MVPLKNWMKNRNLHTLHDISKWDESSKQLKGWNFGSPLDNLTPSITHLSNALIGCAPLNYMTMIVEDGATPSSLLKKGIFAS